jgi:ParB family chromosome partitioning protein
MKRRDVVRALLTPDPSETPAEPVEKGTRVASHAVRAMGLEIGRLTDEARSAAEMRQQIESGATIVELDPELVEPSFATDRLSRTDDADYRRLVSSIRESGQQVPILVRRHPDKAGRYQIAYGHRRREAAAELGIPVKAIVRALSDTELVVAQGKENAERRNLSFIERAQFAAYLESRGFDRATLNAALGVHSAEMTRFLSVAAAVPADIIRAIGPAPKAGRPRWMELASYLERPGALATVGQTVSNSGFRRLNSDRRFETVIVALRDSETKDGSEVVRNSIGDPVIRIDRAGRSVRFVVDERLAPSLGSFLLGALPDLVERFEAEMAAASSVSIG